MLTHADRILVAALVDLVQAFLDVAATSESGAPIPAHQLDAIAHHQDALTDLRGRLAVDASQAAAAGHHLDAAFGFGSCPDETMAPHQATDSLHRN